MVVRYCPWRPSFPAGPRRAWGCEGGKREREEGERGKGKADERRKKDKESFRFPCHL